MLVPPVAAPTVIWPLPGAPPVCWTSPTVPLLTPLVRLVIAVVFPATLVLVVVSWPTLTASVGATPAATFDSVCAAPGAAPVPPVAVRARPFAAGVRWTVPAAPVLRLVIAVVLPATVVLVAFSCPTLTASVGATPAATPDTTRLPPVPARLMLVPPVAAATVTGDVGVACWTRPAVPLLRLVIAVVLLAMLVVLPATVALVAASWPPLTASVEVGVNAPAATLCSATGVPAAVPTSVVLFDATPGVGVVGAAGSEYWIGAAPADAVT